MKILILTDETYAALADVWEAADGTKLTSVDRPALPKAADLHRIAREGDEPQAFAQARDELTAATVALESRREQIHRLIEQAHKLGVRPGVLQKWSGYSARRIHQITNT